MLRAHRRTHQAHWRQRCLARVQCAWVPPGDLVVLPRRGRWRRPSKRPDERRAEERAYRQRVRQALAHGEDPPPYRRYARPRW